MSAVATTTTGQAKPDDQHFPNGLSPSTAAATCAAVVLAWPALAAACHRHTLAFAWVGWVLLLSAVVLQGVPGFDVMLTSCYKR